MTTRPCLDRHEEVAKADVYFNLRSKVWSVKDRATGRVVAHMDRVVVDDATFVVSEAGRQRVLQSGQKNVHAFVRGVAKHDWGTCRTIDGQFADPDVRDHHKIIRIAYNPFRAPFFHDADTGQEVLGTSMAWLHHGKVYSYAGPHWTQYGGGNVNLPNYGR